MKYVKWVNVFNRLNLIFFLLPFAFFLLIFVNARSYDNLTSLSLQQAIEIGLENQPSLKAMESERKMAGYEVGMAMTNFYPKLSANTFWTSGDVPMNYNSLSMPNYIATVPGNSNWLQDFTVMLPLFTGGKNIGTLNKVKREKESAEYDYQSAKLDLILNIKTLYRTGLYYRELMKTYQELVKESEERVKNDREAYEVGKVAYVNVLRNETRLAQSKQMLTNTTRDYQTVLVQLRASMGLDSKSAIDLAQDTTEPEKIDMTKEEALEMTLKSTPDLLAAERKLKAAQSSLSVSRSDLYPQVGLMAMQDFFKSDGSSDSGHSYGLVISFPFFGSGESFYKIKQSKETMNQADFNYQSKKLKVQADLDSAWLAIDAARQNMETTKTGVTQAEEEFRIMKMAYEAGKRINVEYLDAVVALYQAKTDYSKAVLDFNLSVDQLNRITGKDDFAPNEIK